MLRFGPAVELRQNLAAADWNYAGTIGLRRPQLCSSPEAFGPIWPERFCWVGGVRQTTHTRTA